jgi:hypothetical protein
LNAPGDVSIAPDRPVSPWKTATVEGAHTCVTSIRQSAEEKGFFGRMFSGKEKSRRTNTRFRHGRREDTRVDVLNTTARRSNQDERINPTCFTIN